MKYLKYLLFARRYTVATSSCNYPHLVTLIVCIVGTFLHTTHTTQTLSFLCHSGDYTCWWQDTKMVMIGIRLPDWVCIFLNFNRFNSILSTIIVTISGGDLFLSVDWFFQILASVWSSLTRSYVNTWWQTCVNRTININSFQ